MPLVLTAEADGWPAVIERVLLRDGRCIFATTGMIRIGASVLASPFRDHFCRDRWGEPIEWWRTRASITTLHHVGAVELDHVPEFTTLSKKATDDEAHLVVACAGAHRGTGASHGAHLATSHEGREFERAWLALQYPDVWAAYVARNAAETPDAGFDTSL